METYFHEKDDQFHTGSEERIRLTSERWACYLPFIEAMWKAFSSCVKIVNEDFVFNKFKHQNLTDMRSVQKSSL